MPNLQECYLQNFNCKNFKLWNIQIQGLSRAWNIFPKCKDFQGLLKDPMNPDYVIRHSCPQIQMWPPQAATVQLVRPSITTLFGDANTTPIQCCGVLVGIYILQNKIKIA